MASGGHSSSRCAGLSLSRPLLLRSTGSRRAGSVAVAHGPSCSAACGILPDQGLNPCPLHWQADSQPLRHQGSPGLCFDSSLKTLMYQEIGEQKDYCILRAGSGGRACGATAQGFSKAEVFSGVAGYSFSEIFDRLRKLLPPR